MRREIETSVGAMRYRDVGEGSAVVMIHGALVDSRIYDRVVERLVGTHRVIVPDLPLGSHTIPLDADAELSPPVVADMVLELIGSLDLDDLTLVGNDSGGAICQMLLAHDASRVGRLVLTTCDAFEVFPPPPFTYMRWLPRIPGAVWEMGQLMRFGWARRSPIAFGNLSRDTIPDELLADWTRPVRVDRDIRRDAKKLMLGIDVDDLNAASERLVDFDKPATVLWGSEEPYFPTELAERLVATLPQGRLVWVDNTSTYVPWDRPDAVAEAIATPVSDQVSR